MSASSCPDLSQDLAQLCAHSDAGGHPCLHRPDLFNVASDEPESEDCLVTSDYGLLGPMPSHGFPLGSELVGVREMRSEAKAEKGPFRMKEASCKWRLCLRSR